MFGIIDIILTLITYGITYIAYTQSVPATNSSDYLALAVMIIPLWYLLLKHQNLTILDRINKYSLIFWDYLKVISLGGLALFSMSFIFKLEAISIQFILTFLLSNLFILPASRIISFHTLKNYRKKGYFATNIAIIADDDSTENIQNILNRKELGYSLRFILSDSPKLKEDFGPNTMFFHDSTPLHKLLDSYIIDEVIYCRNTLNQQELERYIRTCSETGVIFRMQSDWFGMTGSKAQLGYFSDIPFLTFMNLPSNELALFTKSLMSYLIASTSVVILSPIMVLVAIMIKSYGNGPVLFKQKRVGLRGRSFTMYKFRTMITDAENMKHNLSTLNEADGPVFKIKNDPRITPIGKFLRKSSLDELPQLFNVLKGEMSLIGPRPPVPEEVQQYKRWQRRRLSMKPGITCIWQISPERNKISFEDWMRMDLEYIDQWSLKLDFILLIKTFKAVFKAHGY